MSKNIISVILSLFLHSIFVYAEGFFPDTLVKTSSGYSYIHHLKPKDIVTSCCMENRECNASSMIFQTIHSSSNSFIRIKINDSIICCAPDQQFYSYNQQKWMRADKLTLIDLVTNDNGKPIPIRSLELLQEPCSFHTFSLATNHTYCVSKHNIVVHNALPLMITSTFSMVPATVPIIKTVCTTAAAFFGIHLFNFAKKLWRKCRSSNVDSHRSSSSYHNHYHDPNDPNDDKNKTKNEHPHGFYKEAPYHHKNSRSKSKCPNDGQRCLDYSLPTETNQRVSIEGKEFVVLRYTCPGEYHGFKVSWEDLHEELRQVLIDNGYVRRSGKIIRQITEKYLK